MYMRLVQIQQLTERRVALVEEPLLRLLSGAASIYALAQEALRTGETLSALVKRSLTEELLDYDAVYAGRSSWRLLPPVDHPEEVARCLVSGTGLTHLGSARDRNAMHDLKEDELTDSMRIFQWGLASGKPAAGAVGVAPEWFYKGNGSIIRAPGETLLVPPYAEDGGEEAEVATCYLIGPNGEPYRLGMAAGNEFSDHVFEKKNYLNLAGSKLRTCSLGPELVINPDFESVAGTVSLKRDRKTFWSKAIRTGEAEMCHSLDNIEHHHFKFELNRRPGDVHIHYLGASLLSFGEGVRLCDGDVMEIQFDGFGRPLCNTVQHVSSSENRPVKVRSFS
jgi:hypothetical protein